MFIYLVAIVVIICSIFGLTYSQTSLRAITDVGARLSTIQLPAFSHSTPLIGHPLAGVAGDNGNAGAAGNSSQQSLEIFNDQMIEEVRRAKWSEEDITKDDRFSMERRTFDQKLADANQIGLAASLWSPAPPKDTEKAMKDVINQKYASDGSKPPPKITTNTIFNMIQYETFKEAMAVLQKQQEQEEAARAAAENGQINGKFIQDDEQSIADDEKENVVPSRGYIN